MSTRRSTEASPGMRRASSSTSRRMSLLRLASRQMRRKGPMRGVVGGVAAANTASANAASSNSTCSLLCRGCRYECPPALTSCWPQCAACRLGMLRRAAHGVGCMARGGQGAPAKRWPHRKRNSTPRQQNSQVKAVQRPRKAWPQPGYMGVWQG